MRIVVGFLRSPEGRAALERAIEEARLRDGELVVLHTVPADELTTALGDPDELARLEAQLADSGVRHRLLTRTRGNVPSEDLLQTAKDEDADLIVIGIRRRTPVGKLILGSNAQDVLLHANCAVLAVKAEDETPGAGAHHGTPAG